jgi:hypothetical protein
MPPKKILIPRNNKYNDYVIKVKQHQSPSIPNDKKTKIRILGIDIGFIVT